MGVRSQHDPRPATSTPKSSAVSATLAHVFYAIPLESKPTWRNPPWVTLLLILINVAVFFGPQRTEEKAEQRATAYYFSTSLPEWELPPFVAHLEQTGSRFA